MRKQMKTWAWTIMTSAVIVVLPLVAIQGTRSGPKITEDKLLPMTTMSSLGITVQIAPSPDGLFDFQLSQNYPNPLNAGTVINFESKVQSHISLIVFNILGQRVITLVSELLPPGPHTVSWDGRDDNGQPMSSGIYFYQLSSGTRSRTMKMSIVR